MRRMSIQQRGFSTLVRTCFIAMLLFLMIKPEFIQGVKSKFASKKKANPCKSQVSSWDTCSKLCGMGTSTRVKKSKRRCKLKRETRLCLIRLCDNETKNTPPGSRWCQANIRSRKRRRLVYIGAISEKKYKMKYCGSCSDPTKCCTPYRTKTKKVWFRPPEGKRFAKKMMFIRKCRCHRNCPTIQVINPARDLTNDTVTK